MYILWKEKWEIINKLSFSEKYYDYLENLRKLLDLSIIYYNNWKKLLDTQILLYKFIILFENKCKEENLSKDDIFMYKQLRAIAKSITDGILWRETKYNRVYVSMLSYAKWPWNIKDDVSLTTNKIKKDYLKNDNIVIINDITNQSRIWDYLVLNDYKVIDILEVKKGNKIRGIDYYKEHKTSKQTWKMLDTFNYLHSYPVKNIKASINYFKKISKSIEKSYKNGHSTIKLNKYTSIRIIYNQNLKNPNSAIKDSNAIKNSIIDEKSDEIITISNYDFYVNSNNRYATAVIAPYCIFPFNTKTRIYLMAGILQITSYINITWIKKEFEKENWIIEGNNKDKKMDISDNDTNASNMFYENRVDMSLFKIKKRDWYFSYFTISELQLIAFEFKSYKDVIKSHNEYYEEAKKDKSSGSHLVTFISDKEIYV